MSSDCSWGTCGHVRSVLGRTLAELGLEECAHELIQGVSHLLVLQGSGIWLAFYDDRDGLCVRLGKRDNELDCDLAREWSVRGEDYDRYLKSMRLPFSHPELRNLFPRILQQIGFWKPKDQTPYLEHIAKTLPAVLEKYFPGN